MDLRRRDKQHIMETVEEKTPAPRAHDFARARRDFDVDGMDNVAEGRDEPSSRLSSASARIARLAGMLLIAALISTMEAAGMKSASSWVSTQRRKLSVRRWPGARLWPAGQSATIHRKSDV